MQVSHRRGPAPAPERRRLLGWGWAALALWAAVLAVAAFSAPRLDRVLLQGSTLAPGSESDQARELVNREVRGGEIQDLVLVLASDTWQVEDPAFREAAQAVLAAARQVPGVERVAGYWDYHEERMVGRDGRSTFALVQARIGGNGALDRLVDGLRAAGAAAPAGLQVYVTGEAAFSADVATYEHDALASAEVVVVPVVLVVLVLIFGSFVAALLPLALGLASVLVTLGLLYFYALYQPVDEFARSMVSMIGMGVGVDYSLFLVTRFREELAAGRDRAAAVRRTLATAGKAIAFSGATVAVSAASLFVVNSPIIRSLALAMVLVVLVAVLAAVTLLPVLLYILGPRVSALPVPGLRRRAGGAGVRFWPRWALAVMRRPWLYALVAAAPLLALSYPALQMQTGWPNVSLLPPGAEARQGFAVLQEQFAGGTAAPIDVAVAVRQGTVADATNLPYLYRLAETLRQDPAVAAVISHVSLQPGWDLDRYRQAYVEQPAELALVPGRLEAGAAGLDQGVQALREIRGGLSALAGQVPALASGVRDAGGGAAETAAGLARARAALEHVTAGLDQGAGGLLVLGSGLDGLDGVLGQPGLAARTRTAAAGVGEAAAALRQVAAALARAEAGLGALAAGLDQGSGGIGQVAVALAAAVDGLDRLIPGLDQAGGDLRLAAREAGAVDLGPALARGDLGLRLLMAAGGPAARDTLADLVNVDRGARVARVMVIPREGPDAPATMDLVRRLRTRVLPGAAGEGATVLVGGSTAELVDFSDQIRRALPRVIGLVLVITFLVLVVLLRSLLLPLKAIVMNGLSVAAAYGALVLIFQKGYLSGLLGFTPLGYLESALVPVLFAVLFGLSMDYEVFLLSRIKEAYDRTGQNTASVAMGLEQTAGIITGAAAIMVLVFGAFMLTGMVTIKESGLGLAVAVFLDATLIRIILVPAFMRLAGQWNWWAPPWLLRLLPNLDLKH